VTRSVLGWRSRGWDARPAILAAVAVLAVALVAGVAILRQPTWTLRSLDIATAGEELQPGSWSPDGSRFLFSRQDQFIVVRISDGARLTTGFGSWPVWVDDDTIDAVADIGGGRSQIRRVDLGGGQVTNTILPPILETAKLIGGPSGDLAATTSVGSIWTTILEPESGRVIAELHDVRAIRWAARGALILKTLDLSGARRGSSPGKLRVWTAIGGLQPIGGDLLDVRDAVSASPNGDAIVCVCVASADPPDDLGAIHLVPLDGSPAMALAPIAAGAFQTDPLAQWLDDDSLEFLDGTGLHALRRDGSVIAIPAVDPADLPAEQYYGQSGVLDGGILISAQEKEDGDEGIGRLSLRRLDGTVPFAASLTSVNPIFFATDPAGLRAVVVADPQAPGGPPVRGFVLERG
jgi:hypothetical protein